MVPPSPAEIDAVLSDLFVRVGTAFAEKDTDGGLALADELWERIPEPKVTWDYFFQRVPHTVALYCIEAGQFDAAQRWLDRAVAAYGRLSSEGAQTLDFLTASMLYRTGEAKGAYAYFDAIYRASGRWRFAGAPQEYWDFYTQARSDRRFDESPAVLDQPGREAPEGGSSSRTFGEHQPQPQVEHTDSGAEGMGTDASPAVNDGADQGTDASPAGNDGLDRGTTEPPEPDSAAHTDRAESENPQATAEPAQEEGVPPLGDGAPSSGQLPPGLHDQIGHLLHEGQNRQAQDSLDEARALFTEALHHLPEPRHQWPISIPLYTGLGDVLLRQGQAEDAQLALIYALNGPDGNADAYAWLRLGDARRGLGDIEGAVEAWTGAHTLAGPAIFDRSPQAADVLRERGIIAS